MANSGGAAAPPPPIFAKYFKKSHKLAKIYQEILRGNPPKPPFYRSGIRHWIMSILEVAPRKNTSLPAKNGGYINPWRFITSDFGRSTHHCVEDGRKNMCVCQGSRYYGARLNINLRGKPAMQRTPVPSSTRRWPNVGSPLGQRRRQWPNNTPALVQCYLWCKSAGVSESPSLSKHKTLGSCQAGVVRQLPGIKPMAIVCFLSARQHNYPRKKCSNSMPMS